MHVIEPPFLFGPAPEPEGLCTERVELQQEAATAKLAPALERCRAAGVNASSRVDLGAPALKIIE